MSALCFTANTECQLRQEGRQDAAIQNSRWTLIPARKRTGTYLQINSPTCSAACTAHHQRPYQHHEMSSFMQGALVARARSTGVVASGSLWAIERMYSDKRHSVIFQQCPGDAGGRIRHFVTSLGVTGLGTVRPIKNLTRNSSFALKWLGTPAPNQI